MKKTERDALIETCIAVAKLAGRDVSRGQIKDDCLDAPHKRPSEDAAPLIYIFLLFDNPLKVGKSIAIRGTRVGNHYNPKTKSSLARAILQCKAPIKQLCPQEMHREIDALEWKEQVESWMERNLTLVRLRFDRRIDPMVVELLEIFLQCKLRPLFEGTSRGAGSLKKLQSIDPCVLERLLERLPLVLKENPLLKPNVEP